MEPIYWRFFTEIKLRDAAVACYWGWERLQGTAVLSTQSDFLTLRDAVRSAREHGFSGEVDPAYAGVALRERQGGGMEALA